MSEGLQTRSTNRDQHPGAIEVAHKRKRRTQAEMKEDRERQQTEKETLQKLQEDKIRDLAALEDKISKNDKTLAEGVQTSRPKPRPLKKEVSQSW